MTSQGLRTSKTQVGIVRERIKRTTHFQGIFYPKYFSGSVLSEVLVPAKLLKRIWVQVLESSISNVRVCASCSEMSSLKILDSESWQFDLGTAQLYLMQKFAFFLALNYKNQNIPQSELK